MEIMAQDPGFVLDEVSGLYFHPSSGFFHDANAGWYYNTNDGIYYKFEEGAYIPFAKNEDSVNRIESGTNEDKESRSPKLGSEEVGVSAAENIGHQKLDEGRADETVPDVGSFEGENLPNDKLKDPTHGTNTEILSALEVGFPLWHYDTLRSIYWYYDKDTRAYYQYHEADHVNLNGGEAERERAGLIVSNDDTNGKELELSEQAAVEHAAEESFEPTSGWVEETLIDLYLKGYPNDSADKDDGPWITSADIFEEDSVGYSNGSHLNRDELCHDGGVKEISCFHADAAEMHCTVLQGPLDESDNEGSEELEEGEWVPEEPLRIVDGNPSLVDDQCHMPWETENAHPLSAESKRIEEHDIDVDEDELEEGEIVEEINELVTNDGGEFEASLNENENVPADSYQRLEEQWQEQFGQVVREKPKEHVVPGAVDLWDWTVVEMEPNPRKPGQPVKKKLVGRIASSVTKLVSVGSGLIRTSAILATELDFVKVSSGKIYRLRRPSLKHLNSPEPYDTANPTKGWGFPSLGLSRMDHADEQNDIGTPDHTQRRTEARLEKPFVPNTGHWQFQRLASANAKKTKVVPPALLASKFLSPEEILMNEQRKQKYRDRAAERRILHGGFGTGPGQKGLTAHQEELLDAENAVSMEATLKNAASAPPLGKDNIGKKMLTGMGWKEGQALGMEGGLVTPLVAEGNNGRAGLGWN